MLIYDCEIVHALPSMKEPNVPDIIYCRGWEDYAGMGIACIGAYDTDTGQTHLFCQDNFPVFQAMVDAADVLVGFNTIGFDNKLCAAHGISVPDEKSYDLLVELWVAAGLPPTYAYPSHVGFGLNAVCSVNLNETKTGHGASAPVLWQHGKRGEVIDYCLHDVWLTVNLLRLVERDVPILDPRDGVTPLRVRPPVRPVHGVQQLLLL